MKQTETDAQAKIDLIVKTINDSRKKLSPQYGGIVLRIGYPLLLASLAVAVLGSRIPDTYAAWISIGAMLVTLLTSWKLSRMINMDADAEAYIYQPLLLKIWTGMILVIVCCLLSILIGAPETLQLGGFTGTMAAIGIAGGLCSYITGGIFQSKWIQGLGIISLIGTFGLIRDMASVDTIGRIYSVYTFILLCALIVPGHILRYQAKKSK